MFQAGLLARLHPPPAPSHAMLRTVASCRFRQAYSSGGLHRNVHRGNRQNHRFPVSPSPRTGSEEPETIVMICLKSHPHNVGFRIFEPCLLTATAAAMRRSENHWIHPSVRFLAAISFAVSRMCFISSSEPVQSFLIIQIHLAQSRLPACTLEQRAHTLKLLSTDVAGVAFSHLHSFSGFKKTLNRLLDRTSGLHN